MRLGCCEPHTDAVVLFVYDILSYIYIIMGTVPWLQQVVTVTVALPGIQGPQDMIELGTSS